MFDVFNRRADAHLRRAQEYLQAAQVARIEHQVAAEHHAALASMYAQRVSWLEQELAESSGRFTPLPLRGVSSLPDSGKRAPESVVSLARAQRSGVIENS
jgi:hypothetical protein